MQKLHISINSSKFGVSPYSHAVVSLLLNGVLYGNNSIVTLDEIGEDSAALFCLTNKIDCCRASDSPPVRIVP